MPVRTAPVNVTRNNVNQSALAQGLPQQTAYPYQNPNFRYKPAPQSQPKKKQSPVFPLLLIGAGMIVLSGIIFSTAMWIYISDWGRVGIIAAAMVIFFALSFISHKKLKLENTSTTFYLMAVFFGTTAFITMGYFELLGYWLSADGEGAFALFALGAVIIALFAAVGKYIYKKEMFLHIFLYSLLCTLTMLGIQLFDENDALVLFLNIASAAVLAAHFNFLKDSKPFTLFTRILYAFYAILALPCLLQDFLGGWTATEFALTLLWLAQCIYYSIKLESKSLRYVHPILTGVILLELSFVPKSLTDIECMNLFAATLFAAALIYRIRALMSKVSMWIFPAALFVLTLCGGMGALEFEEDLLRLMTALELLIVVTISAVGERGYLPLKNLIFIPAAAFSFRLSQLIYDNGINASENLYRYPSDDTAVIVIGFTTGLIMTVFLLVMRFFGSAKDEQNDRISLSLRTPVNDIGLSALITLCVSGIATLLIGGSYVSLTNVYFYPFLVSLASAATVLSFVLEKKPASRTSIFYMRCLFPIMLIFSAFHLGQAVRFLTAGKLYSIVTLATLFALSCCFVFIRKIRTPFSDIAIPAAMFISLIGCDSNYIGALGFLLISVNLAYVGQEREQGSHRLVMQIAAPVALLLAASCLPLEQESLCFAAAAVLLLFMAVASYFFTEKNRAYIKYVYIVSAGISLCISASMVQSVIEIIIVCVLAAALFVYALLQDINITAALGAISIYICANRLLDICDFGESEILPPLLAFAAIGILFAATSIFYRNKLTYSKERPLKFDMAIICAFLTPLATLFSAKLSTLSDMTFATFLELFVLFALAVNKASKERTNAVLKTLSAAFLCLSFYLRPFWHTDNEFISIKINILPILAFALLIKLIWRSDKKISDNFSFVSFLAAFLLLIIDVLIHQTILNTIVVLCVIAVILIISFALKSLRWFAISAASLVGLILYLTHTQIAQIGWWLYLLIIGILLIAVAVSNEYLKKQGLSIRLIIDRFRNNKNKQK